ncbi:VOC family protein [Naasia sp. SYSU D00948]|uniref:VOC family protein n=1 Tax=Naasia sp. SYSU D00948 TaxID=2817379 RepID=UPI001FEEAB0B|nr:VOC family protein [Naasia sp. SYSU D00948]
MTIGRVQLFSIPVSDQDRARDFYVEKLGFELLQDNPMGPEQRWVMVGPGGAETAITLVTWFPSMPPGSLQGVVFETEDLEEDVAALRARGVDIPGDVETVPWGAIRHLHGSRRQRAHPAGEQPALAAARRSACRTPRTGRQRQRTARTVPHGTFTASAPGARARH